MIISGLQKLTLLDFPEKTAATVFLGGCNLRCPFCHNSGIVFSPRESEISDGELFSYLEKRVGILDGVCVTGGEPTLCPDIADFIKRIKELGYQVKLDTNGTYPERLKSLIEAGLLDYIAMDIKNSPDRYGETVGLEIFDVAPVLRSVEIIKTSGVLHEFRTTLVEGLHSERELELIGQWLGEGEKYFLQKFVDSGACIKEGMKPLSDEVMQKCLKAVSKYVTNAQLRGI